jgi:ATP synthase protein I
MAVEVKDRNAEPSLERENQFARTVETKVSRKLRMQRDTTQGVWFGLGMSGLVGWSVAVPTLLGAMLGIWLDHKHSSHYSWTLMLMIIGLIIGCANAWHWLSEQDAAMRKANDKGSNDE